MNNGVADPPVKKQGRLEIYGTTEFRVGSSTKPISVDIAIGYRRATVESASKAASTEHFVYAKLTVANKKAITLAQLIEACDGDASQIPDALKNTVGFKSFAINYATSINSSKFEMILDTRIHLDNTELDASITIQYERKGAEKSFSFGGTLFVGDEHRFDLKFNKTGDASYLFAGYQLGGKKHIDLRQLSADIFGSSTASQLPDVSFDLEEFKAFILYRKQGDQHGLLLGMGANLDLDLGNLPMAGPVIIKERSLAFKDVLVLYAKGSFNKEELKQFPGVPYIDIAPGFNIATCLLINGVESYYPLNEGTGDHSEKPEPLVPEKTGAIPGEISAKAKWVTIDKKLGPVHLQRIGFLYNKGKVGLLMDASVASAGMGMQLIGLGLGFTLKWPPSKPEFYIDGLGLSYIKDPVRISGMFTRVTPKPTEVYSYYGAAQLSFSKFNISGIGAYSKLKANDQISLFVYAMYQGSIGGPAFFFVTGIAAGFGYNRKVRIPDITEVNSFPLVAMALNPNPKKTLNDILSDLIAKDCIPTSPGDYWLAIGVKFTSFKIIESFVLVIVQFGTATEFTILGLSVLAWPDKNNPIAYIELALKAHFGTSTDAISVEAMLTPNSYVLDRNCRLTGGFAFYTWVSGPHEGDFVITLGGYHPRFIKPKHYPDVQRLGLNWRLSSLLEIKGGLYYALTPSCIMAGGRLEITYSLSFLRASIVVWADMLISWAPFYYTIEIGISVRIDANIDVGLFTIHFNLEMGAQLRIWGPPFAGSVYVDWSIFSFTIPFGSANVNKEYLDWPKFRKQFIPAKQEESEGKDGPATEVYRSADISITSGIIRQESTYVVVNPHKLSIKIETPMPVITANLMGSELSADTEMIVGGTNIFYKNRNTALGIRPVNKRTLSSTLNVTIDKMDGLVCSTYGISVPEALWSPEERTSSNKEPGGSKVLPDTLKGMVLSPKIKPIPAGTPRFDLDGKFTPVNKQLTWTYIGAFTGPDNAYYKDTRKEITARLAQRAQRKSEIIVAAVAAQGMSMNRSAEDMKHEVQWVERMDAEPVIVQTGGMPQYKNK